MIEVKSITKRIVSGGSKIEIIKDVSLSVKAAEILAIVGHSGSGKSSLLAIMSGIDKPDEGDVFVNGKSIYLLSENALAQFRNKNFGIVFQSFNLIANLSAEENVEIPKLLAGKKDRKQTKAADLLELVGMKDKLGVKVASLSGGEQQRVAIARALIQEPQFLFADEPTGSLDYENTSNILNLFKKIRDELRVSVIMVTHDDYVAENANRVVRLNYGVLEDAGHKSELNYTPVR